MIATHQTGTFARSATTDARTADATDPAIALPADPSIDELPASRPDTSRTSRLGFTPVSAGLIGFFAGVLVWHAVGFWAFLAAVVSGGASTSTALLPRWLLGKPAGQISEARRVAKPTAQNQANPRASSAETCVTLVRHPQDGGISRRECPLGAASLVSRHLATRSDRLPMRLPQWTTATSTETETTPQPTDREEAAALQSQPPQPGIGRWSPSSLTTGSIR